VESEGGSLPFGGRAIYLDTEVVSIGSRNEINRTERLFLGEVILNASSIGLPVAAYRERDKSDILLKEKITKTSWQKGNKKKIERERREESRWKTSAKPRARNRLSARIRNNTRTSHVYPPPLA